MKILIVSPVFWPESFRINDLAGELAERGHDIEVLAGMPNYPAGAFFPGYGWRGPFEELHGKVRVLRFPLFPRRKGRAWELSLNYVSWVIGAAARLLWRRSRDWDVIFVFQTTPVTAGMPALLARRLSGAPAIIWVQDLWPEIVKASGLLTHPMLLRPIRWLANAIYRSFDLVLTQSDSFRDALGRRGIPPEKLTRIYNWAEDTYSSKPAAPVEKREPWQNGFVLMFTGNLGRMQALPTLLDAADLLRAHRDIQWVFLGDGVLQEWMETSARERGLLGATVHLLGRHPVEEMPRFYATADAVLLGLGRSEALTMTVPGKLQGYFAAAKPVVASADGEVAQVLEASGAGWAAPAEDPRALADLVLRLRAMPAAEREEVGRRGRRYYEEHFRREVCVAEIESALRTMAESKPLRRRRGHQRITGDNP